MSRLRAEMVAVGLLLTVFAQSRPYAATLPPSVLSRAPDPTLAAQRPEACESPYKRGGRPNTDELLHILEANFKWKIAGVKVAQRAELCGADLTGLDLHTIAAAAQENARASLLASSIHVSFGNKVSALRGADLRSANLTGVDLSHLDLAEADLRGAYLSDANLNGAQLAAARLDGANLQGANLTAAGLQGASLIRADLSGAVMTGVRLDFANLTEANLASSDLSGAYLGRSRLTRAILRDTVLSGSSLEAADLRGAELSGLVFDLEPGALPSILGIAFAKNLSLLTFRESPLSLVEMREDFRKKELRQQEREITFAIRRTERLHAWKQGGWQRVESVVNLILLEYPYQYGMSPWRPLLILGGLILLFAVLYASLIAVGGRSQVVIAPLEDEGKGSVAGGGGKRQTINPGGTLLRRLFRYSAFGLWFSLLSAFRVPWKEIEVGGLVNRLQPWRTLRGTGWVRPIAGIQSLISIYLVVLWVIGYFRRLFE